MNWIVIQFGPINLNKIEYFEKVKREISLKKIVLFILISYEDKFSMLLDGVPVSILYIFVSAAHDEPFPTD